MNSYMFFYALIYLWYSWYACVFISYDYIYCWLNLWDIICWCAVSIISTYCTNAYCLQIVHVGSSEYRVSWRIEYKDIQDEKKWWVLTASRTNIYVPLCFLYVLHFMWDASKDVSFMSQLDGLLDNVIRIASAIIKYLFDYVQIKFLNFLHLCMMLCKKVKKFLQDLWKVDDTMFRTKRCPEFLRYTCGSWQ